MVRAGRRGGAGRDHEGDQVLFGLVGDTGPWRVGPVRERSVALGGGQPGDVVEPVVERRRER